MLNNFKNIRKTGDGYTACCPAHADQKNSLLLQENDGEWQIKCMAGCTLNDILHEANLSYRDLTTKETFPVVRSFMQLPLQLTNIPAFAYGDYVYFEYPDKSLHARHCQDKAKQFWFRHGHTCYHYENVSGYVNNDVLLVCEGETDTIAAIEAGYRAIGVPGAKALSKKRVQWIRDNFQGRVSKLIFMGDNDRAGLEFGRYGKTILDKYFECEIFHWPSGLQTGYDVRQYIIDHGRLPSLENTLEVLEPEIEILPEENRLYHIARREMSKYRHLAGSNRSLFAYWNRNYWVYPCESEIIPTLSRCYPEEKLFIHELKNIRDYIKAHCDVLDITHLNKPIGNFTNCVVDPKEGIRRALPSDWVFNPVYEYSNVLGESEFFLQTIKQWYPWANEKDVEFILELLAYITLIKHNEYGIFVNFYGEGANGKTKLVELLMSIVGHGHYETVDLSTLNHFSTASFLHKQLIIAPDASAILSDIAYSVIKQIATEKYMKFEPKGQGSFTAENTSKLVIATNHRLAIRKGEDNHGFWRRLIVLPHEVTFPIDASFGRKLHAELPKIINTLMKAAINLEKRGKMLPTPDKCLSYLDDLKTRVNPLKTWVDGKDWTNIQEFMYSDIMLEYVNWLEDNGSAMLGRLLDKAKGANDNEKHEAIAKSLAKKHGGIGGEFTGYISKHGFSYGKDRKRFIVYRRDIQISNASLDMQAMPGLIRSVADFNRCLDRIKEKKLYTFDTETTIDEKLLERKIVGWSIGVDNEQWVFLPFHLKYDFPSLERLKEIFSDPTITCIMHNAKYDLHMLANHGIYVNNKIHDTMVMAYCINPDAEKGLKVLGQRYLQRGEANDYKKLFGKKSLLEHDDIPKMYHYMMNDALLPLELFEHPVFQKVIETEIYKTNMEITLLTWKTEREGIPVDEPHLMELLDNTILDQAALCMFWNEINVNPNSNKQLGEFFLSENVKFHFTENGMPAFAAENVQDYITRYPDNESLKRLADYRENEASKRLLEKLTKHIKDDRLWGEFNVCVTATGRLSSSNPNLQNIPNHSELGKAIRKCIVAPEGKILYVADYSQIELRLLAHFSQDRVLLFAFENDTDLHALLASKLYKKPVTEITKAERNIGKTMNFSIMYGAGPKRLSQTTGLNYDQAKEFIQIYKETYSGVSEWIDSVKFNARQNGFVDTISGHRRYLSYGKDNYENWLSDTKSVNTIIQGSAADLMKQAWKNLSHILGITIILQVHDEFVFIADDDRYVKEVKYAMECDGMFSIPTPVDIKVCQNWFEGK